MQLSIPKIPEPLIVWEKIEILTSDDINAGVYTARIEDFVEDGMEITKPEILKGEVLLRDNCNVIISVTKSDAIYHFRSTIHKKNVDGIERYVLSHPVFVRRIQRREFARVVYSTPVEYTLFHKMYKENQEWHRSYSWDISGSGLLLETKDFVKQDSILLMKIQLFEELDICLPVLGQSHRTLLDNQTRLSGVALIPTHEISGYENNLPIGMIKGLSNSFSTTDQEKLISFVFNQQIEQRKKGLL